MLFSIKRRINSFNRRSDMHEGYFILVALSTYHQEIDYGPICLQIVSEQRSNHLMHFHIPLQSYTSVKSVFIFSALPAFLNGRHCNQTCVVKVLRELPSLNENFKVLLAFRCQASKCYDAPLTRHILGGVSAKKRLSPPWFLILYNGRKSYADASRVTYGFSITVYAFCQGILNDCKQAYV